MNKQELKDRLDDYDSRVGYMKGAVIKITREELHDLIDQLNEPEITEEQAWEVIERANHQHIAPAYVWIYKKAIQKGLTPADITGLEEDSTLSKKETVVIPRMIGAYIKEERVKNTLGNIADEIYNSEESWSNLSEEYKWMRLNFTLFARAWLDGYTIKKESEWIVKRENGDYVDYFSGSLYELNISVTSSLDATAPYKFTDKSDADAVAILIDGIVELIEGQMYEVHGIS